MNCDTFRLQIDAYADGALPPLERAVFEEHRANCADCHRSADQAQQLGSLLRAELPTLAAASPSEQVALREAVLEQLGFPSAERAAHLAWRIWLIRSLGTGLALLVALVAALILLPDSELNFSAAEIVDHARATAEEHKGMSGVLYWEAEWSQRFPSREEITRTFEIWFDFDSRGRYHLTQRDPDGRVFSEMVRDGKDHMWQLSRSVSAGGSEQIQVDEIILSPAEMQGLSSWYVPSPFLDDLGRFTDVPSSVERVADIEVAGRRAYVLSGQLFGFGQPGVGNRIDPVTSTVQLIVDAETYWVLGRTERVPGAGQQKDVVAGIVQRTRRFALLSLEQVPPNAFDFTPPPEAKVRRVEGIGGYYAPISDAIGLEDAAKLTGFSLVLPSDLPSDLRPRPFFRYTCPGGHAPGNRGCEGQGSGQAGTFGIVYLGRPGRQAYLLEYEQAQPLRQAARVVAAGKRQAWLVPDPIGGHAFSLHLLERQPEPGPDGRRWPGGVELHVWGLSLNEAVAMLASMQPYRGDEEGGD
jgi:outer membrane lipoprotein-sorting protein